MVRTRRGPPDLRTLVVNEGRKLQDRVQKLSFDALGAMRKRWADQGGSIIRLSDAEQKQLVGMLQSVGPTVTTANPALSAYYKSVQAAAAKH